MKKILSKTITLLLVLTMMCGMSISANAATLNANNSQTFYVMNTDLVTGTVTVNCYLSQEYAVNGTLTTYTKRTAMCTAKYGTFVQPSVIMSAGPRYVDANNTTTRTFTWSADTGSYITEPFDVMVAKVKNSTSVTMATNNSKYYYMSYQVYDTDLIDNSNFGELKMALAR